MQGWGQVAFFFMLIKTRELQQNVGSSDTLLLLGSSYKEAVITKKAFYVALTSLDDNVHTKPIEGIPKKRFAQHQTNYIQFYL